MHHGDGLEFLEGVDNGADILFSLLDELPRQPQPPVVVPAGFGQILASQEAPAMATAEAEPLHLGDKGSDRKRRSREDDGQPCMDPNHRTPCRSCTKAPPFGHFDEYELCGDKGVDSAATRVFLSTYLARQPRVTAFLCRSGIRQEKWGETPARPPQENGGLAEAHAEARTFIGRRRCGVPAGRAGHH